MLKVAWAAFGLVSEACQTSMSTWMLTLHPFDKETASCNSLHDWLKSLAMDLAALCDMWR